MRRLIYPVILVAAISLTAYAGGMQTAAASGSNAQQAAGQTFAGEIMDSACAAMGSHQGMMKQEGAKDAKDCTLKCVASGSTLVLFDSATKTTYQLSDQAKAKEYAGQKVRITGTLDSATKTINVQGIEGAR